MEKTNTLDLEAQLQKMIVQSCNVLNPPTETLADAPLIGPDSPFGLDSLDAVEVVVLVQKNFQVRIASQETSREVLQSLRTLADYIRKEQGE
ncbi:MAG: phosphopantetheine-binding protein [Desulfuromonadales bacterium]|jgi:acyl carrier protein